MDEPTMSEEQFEELQRTVNQKIDEIVEMFKADDDKKQGKHDEALCGQINAFVLGIVTMFNIAAKAQEHADHPSFVWNALNFIASLEPDLSFLRTDIMRKVQQD